VAISKEVIDRIRQAVDIVQVIDAYVPLKRAGTNYKALSPFNKEKTPSFFVSPDRQTFKCFSSGHGGDVFKFIMLYENLDFPAAVRRVAEKAGIEVPQDGPRESDESKSQRQMLLRIHGELLEYWRDTLAHDRRAEPAREYMHRREIPLSWIQEFGLGYAPSEWDDCVKWAKRKGFQQDHLLQARLLVAKENGRVYDFFRGRLMFPIRNDQGAVIAFSGRLLDPNAKEAKYVNSPDSPIFNKGKVLFAFDRAKRPILDADRVILCEGQIDVLRCHSVGITNVVAPLGTAFTQDHCRMIKRCTSRLVICLDADRAGQNATTRAAGMFLEFASAAETMLSADLGIEVVKLPPGQDPDSLIVKEGGEAMKQLLSRPKEYLDFLVEHLEQQHSKTSAEGMRRLVEEVVQFLRKVPSAVVLEKLKNKAAVLLQIPVTLLDSEMEKAERAGKARPQPESQAQLAGPAAAPLAVAETIQVPWSLEMIFQWILAQPDLIPEIQRLLQPEWLVGIRGRELLEKVMQLYNDDVWGTPAALLGHLTDAEQNYFSGLMTGEVAGHLNAMAPDKRQAAIDFACARLQRDWVVGQILIISNELRQSGLTLERKVALVQKQTELNRQKNALTAKLSTASFPYFS